MAVSDDDKKELKDIIRETWTELETEKASKQAEDDAKNKAKEGTPNPNDGGNPPPRKSLAQRLLG
jgi:hypothetical protein